MKRIFPILLFSFLAFTFYLLTFSLWWLIATFLFAGLCAVYLYDVTQNKHALLKNFPILGHGRYIADWMRPKIYQYFVEPDTGGRPITRIDRSVIYQRAKNTVDTTPFGTQLNVYEEGYEWLSHSIKPVPHALINYNPRVKVGGKDCAQPYESSLLNVSAMSFGSLSGAAIEALNGGAALGSFAHNTGEGGLSDHHLKNGGDIIFQFGTGYFGVRDLAGNFSDERFALLTANPQIKMIEIKLSQGAKPGHGGILPASKATPEIAKIRHIEPYKEVVSPAYHTAFDTPREMVKFIGKCRELSGGKPVGFKLCVGQEYEFVAICKAMISENILPDFITVDGGEGGTGAAPLEFSNSVGMPLYEGLSFVYNTLIGFNIKKQITLFASGKITNGFHIFKSIALGADGCNSARGMMMALGCIQALECNKNTCPTGVATQDPDLVKGLDVTDKKQRVFHFQKNTIKSFVELMSAAGLTHYDQINRSHIFKRVAMNRAKRYDQLFPYIVEGCLLAESTVPREMKNAWFNASPDSFYPRFTQVFIEED